MTLRAALAALILGCVAASAVAAEGDQPFAAATLCPEDVSHFVHLRDAPAVRRELAGRPLGRWAARLLEGDFGRAWRELARTAGMTEAALADFWLGHSATLIVRRGETTGDTEWVLLTEQADRERVDDLLRQMDPTRRPPRAQLPVFKLPDHHLLVARDGNRYIVGSAQPSRLFDEVVDRLVADEVSIEGTLAAHRTVARGRALGPGSIEVFYRHGDPLLSGSNAIVASLDGNRLTLRHRGAFDVSPFNRPRTERTWNMAPLAAFERHSLVAMAEPTDIGGGRLWRYVESLLRWPLISAELRDLIGDCRILAIGEVEGRLEEHETDMLIPTGVLALRIDGEAGEAEAALDTSIIRIIDRLNNLYEGSLLIETPARREMAPGASRHVDLQGAGQHFAGGFPVMKSASLDWTVASGPNGRFCLVSSHPQQLANAVRAIRETPVAANRTGDWSSCGTMNGRALSTHLYSYVGQPRLLTSDHGPESLDEVRASMLALSGFAAGVERCRWQLRRPTDRTVELEVQITLSERESAVAAPVPCPAPTP